MIFKHEPTEYYVKADRLSNGVQNENQKWICK